ncbi:MAG: winged helix-turn-helix transcriptional regulator [Saccharopolyspora sp.]|uniref:MarR family winged helix-turn-helix transcriptional regulator n=1 Tax=Saccharopolyspora TaxID=1835 RepID=UPI00190CD511|nr:MULTISPECIES: MarR family winged helix-turn-helix transcriptional regulator [unclassified Saccharopolyspora]MBK0866010.1 winged helix-turn-helix transcriptional regulator [Saccharopolyspora sp. HNM0986]MBQ6639823.1 winged helix-turn-helix transcriptional regulator [Saccharopolyspora sp.]
MGPTPESCGALLRPLRALIGLKQIAVQTLNQHVHTDLPYAATGLLGELVHCGESRASELAAHRVVDASVVSRQVSQLEQAGLITRRADPQDRRVALLRATPEGEQALARIERGRAEWLSTALQDWDEQQVRELAGLLDSCVADIRAAALPPAPQATPAPQPTEHQTGTHPGPPAQKGTR